MQIVHAVPARRTLSNILDTLIAAFVGAAIAAVAWVISGNLDWFSAIPVIAIMGALQPAQRITASR